MAVTGDGGWDSTPTAVSNTDRTYTAANSYVGAAFGSYAATTGVKVIGAAGE